jgi:hypothetical protein
VSPPPFFFLSRLMKPSVSIRFVIVSFIHDRHSLAPELFIFGSFSTTVFCLSPLRTH